MSFGIHNVTVNSTKETQLSINQTASTTTDVIARIGIGTRPLTGLLFLAAVSYFLYDYDVSLDLGAAIMIPLSFILGRYGWLPYGQGLMYGLLVVIAGITSYGFAKFALQ